MGPKTSKIDRRSAVPLYSQLKRLLVADLAVQGLEPGDRMPGEHELCESYDVSRTVVRQALLELEHEGVIRRERGRGTFVADLHSSRGIGGALVGTFEDIQSEGTEQHSYVVRKGVVPATALVARDLQVGVGDEVVEIERIREVDGVKWAFTRTHLPMAVGLPLLDLPLEDVSLFGILERDYGIRFERANRSVEVGLAPETVASALEIAAGAPMLVMRSLSLDGSGRPVERFVGYHRGDRSRMEIEVRHAPQEG
ncbi:GntR family transcriptional regulator [Kineosporia babensis]|uniref:GntR family transcriptional regulator n=1 Tax=Kineosporia babensis TaxID=499548 RepID=A0A9X1NIB0_9ACTN|nr:GntR family transcriptional regulator [Kineosporia babensis]MCD5314089.1 GntR family transcriptional regulator [Kineosporia babensis]